MADFEVPGDLSFNRGLIADPEVLARDRGAVSWLYLCGADAAPFAGSDELRVFVVKGLEELAPDA